MCTGRGTLDPTVELGEVYEAGRNVLDALLENTSPEHVTQSVKLTLECKAATTVRQAINSPKEITVSRILGDISPSICRGHNNVNIAHKRGTEIAHGDRLKDPNDSFAVASKVTFKAFEYFAVLG